MNIDAKKLKLIERFMNLRDESALNKLELAISQIEMDVRVQASEDDIINEKTRSYEAFSKEVKMWIKEKKNMK